MIEQTSFRFYCFVQVTLKSTGQIMVMKETKTLDKEAQKIFVKEVGIRLSAVFH
jgi:hypothetical protein